MHDIVYTWFWYVGALPGGTLVNTNDQETYAFDSTNVLLVS
jgi:hypothetical protein